MQKKHATVSLFLTLFLSPLLLPLSLSLSLSREREIEGERERERESEFIHYIYIYIIKYLVMKSSWSYETTMMATSETIFVK